MSLAKNKDSLFGVKPAGAKPAAAGSASVPTSAPPATPAAAPAAPAGKTAGLALKTSSTQGKPAVSLETKRRKVAEAQEQSEKGMNALKTSLFQWKPDHLAAASYFENSANIYKQADELKTSTMMMVQAADSHEASGASGSAALCRLRAADTAREMGDAALTRKLLLDAAESWGIYGDLVKYGETLAKLAKEEESHDAKRAKDLYFQAIERICPNDTPREQLGRAPVVVVDITRGAFAFLVRAKKYTDALQLATRMVQLFEGFEIESSMCKALLAITVLQLTLGDAVQAQQTYLQEHLNNTAYMRSKESELADLLVLAFTNHDLDLLDKAKMHSQLSYLDREVQVLIRDLDIFAEVGSGAADPTPAPASRAADQAGKQTLFAAPSKPKAAPALAPVPTPTPAPTPAPAPAPAPATAQCPPPQAPVEEVENDRLSDTPLDLDDLIIGEDEPEDVAAPVPAPAPTLPDGDEDEDEIDLS